MGIEQENPNIIFVFFLRGGFLLKISIELKLSEINTRPVLKSLFNDTDTAN